MIASNLSRLLSRRVTTTTGLRFRSSTSAKTIAMGGLARYQGEPQIVSDGVFESAQVSIDREYLATCGHIQAAKELRQAVRQLRYNDIRHLRVRCAEGGCGRHFDIVPAWNEQASEAMVADAAQLTQIKQDLGSIPCVKSVEVNDWQTNPVPDERGLLLGGSGDTDHKAGTENKLWAARLIKLDKSWNVSKGGGVLIAHPDTGYIPNHPELNSTSILQAIDHDFYDDDDEPADDDGSHGLGTGSVIVSRHAGEMYGAAPEATLVPLRVSAPRRFDPSGGVVLLSYRRLRDAIRYARVHGCDVISISLGGLGYNTGLHNAIKAAYNEGIIIVAAGGNMTLNIPIYPAKYPEVIGCSSCNIDGSHWFYSAWGDHVEISAPGESVWRAVFDGQTPLVERSSGTSYATTHIASLAALWLSKHGGRRALLHRCAAEGLPASTVVDEFRKLLTATAQRSYSLNSSYGPIVDAQALLAASLAF